MPVEILKNPWRHTGLAETSDLAAGTVETDARAALALYDQCPAKHQTELRASPALAEPCGVDQVWLKMEDQRMGLGSFKALGAAYAIAKQAAKKVGSDADAATMATALEGETFICASAGNHGLSVAAGARLFGAKAVVLLSDTVPEEFADRLRQKGAVVERAGENYEASMVASKQMAEAEGWNLLSDGSWLGYSDPPRDVMEGYLIMGHEVADQIAQPPTHVFLQAGVGGLAAGCTVTARSRWGDDVQIAVVEPQAAPALIESVRAGRCVDTQGPVSSMGRLDCKTPSHLALKYLATEADYFVTIDDAEVESCVDHLRTLDVETTPSGAAGVAVLRAINRLYDGGELGITSDSRVLCYISEGPA